MLANHEATVDKNGKNNLRCLSSRSKAKGKLSGNSTTRTADKTDRNKKNRLPAKIIVTCKKKMPTADIYISNIAEIEKICYRRQKIQQTKLAANRNLAKYSPAKPRGGVSNSRQSAHCTPLSKRLKTPRGGGLHHRLYLCK